jgi:hypothetical protein
VQSKVLVRLIAVLAVAVASFISFPAGSVGFLDEFSSVYHSNAIIEVGVVLDETGYPKESCYLGTIKGGKEDVDEVLSEFGICKKKKAGAQDQKRVMFFYRNDKGQLRSMNLIKKGVGPYSDEDTYADYIKMVKFLDRKFAKYNGDKEGMIILDDRSTCGFLRKNKYFIYRYGENVSEDGFVVGGDSGVFKEFYPLVKIDCARHS